MQHEIIRSKENNQPSPTDSKVKKWVAESGLETKGPLIVTTSMPLKYSFNITQRSHQLVRGEDYISGPKLEALLKVIPPNSKNVFVFGAFLNLYRHYMVSSISFAQVDQTKSDEDLWASAQAAASAEAKEWETTNEPILKPFIQKQYLQNWVVSSVEGSKKINSLLTQTYTSKKNAKLNKILEHRAKETVKDHYPDLQRLIEQENKVCSVITGEFLTKDQVIEKLTENNIRYLIDEFATLAHLVLESKSSMLVYAPNKVTKSKKQEMVESKSKTKADKPESFSFAQKLMNLVIEIVTETRLPQALKVGYQEVCVREAEASLVDTTTLLALFQIIVTIPYMFATDIPEMVFLFCENLDNLGKKISTMVLPFLNSITNPIIAEEKQRLPILDSNEDLNTLITWMGGFLAQVMLSEDPNIRMSVIKLSYLIKINLPHLEKSIHQIAIVKKKEYTHSKISGNNQQISFPYSGSLSPKKLLKVDSQTFEQSQQITR